MLNELIHLIITLFPCGSNGKSKGVMHVLDANAVLRPPTIFPFKERWQGLLMHVSTSHRYDPYGSEDSLCFHVTKSSLKKPAKCIGQRWAYYFGIYIICIYIYIYD